MTSPDDNLFAAQTANQVSTPVDTKTKNVNPGDIKPISRRQMTTYLQPDDNPETNKTTTPDDNHDNIH
jgi:hypothetical protein